MIRLICLDLETTGIDPLEDRIVTYSLIGINGDGRIAMQRSGLVNPGVPIPPEAAQVHGVTTEQATTQGESPATALAHISSALLYALQSRTAVCAFNARFDLTMIHAELERHDAPIPPMSSLLVVDPLIIDRQIDKYRRGRRTLEAVAKRYGVTLDNAHTADADALAAGLTAQEILTAHPDLLADGLDQLHENQTQWAAEQAASLQAHFRKTDPQATVEARWPYYTKGVTHEPAAAALI